MRTSLLKFSGNEWIKHTASQEVDSSKAQVVVCFGQKEKMGEEKVYLSLKDKFPAASIALCSTAGEIYNNAVYDNSLVAFAMQLEKTTIQSASVYVQNFADSYAAGIALAGKFPKEQLIYLMVYSDGSLVNGSELVKGLNDATGKKVLITGGLAGDSANFKSTLVGLNGTPAVGTIVAIAFYGSNLVVTHGSQGGWDVFGTEKEITRSTNNVLLEIDGQNALDIYKKYLGDEVQNLPGAALLFPLSVTIPGVSKPVVRTILSIDEDKKTMTFAGDVPEGSKVRMMRANFDRLTEAASTAAHQTILERLEKPRFALLVSCVGRKLILGPRIDEEVEAVSDTLGKETLLAGFYSYGEISPFNDGGNCQLHNQTMTITSFYELP
jgi:hypothetical protein